MDINDSNDTPDIDELNIKLESLSAMLTGNLKEYTSLLMGVLSMEVEKLNKEVDKFSNIATLHHKK